MTSLPTPVLTSRLALLVALPLLGGGAAAQPAAEPAEAGKLAPIVVRGARAEGGYRTEEASTGVLGELAPLETPFSVTSLTRDLLVNQQAAYLGDFLKNDPSAAVGNVVVSFATLRGFSVGSGGFLLDGLQLGSLVNDGRISMDAFERVDVLKGASAFLTGLGSSSSLGGVINYVPKVAGNQPVRDVFVMYGPGSQVGAGADVGARFGSDQAFGARLNVSARDGETSVEDMTWRQHAVSLNTDWRAGRDLTVQAGLYHVANRFDQMPAFFVGVSGADGSAIPIPKAPDTDRNFTPAWNTFDQRSSVGWLRGDWSFAPEWTLTLQYGAGQNDRPYGEDMDTRYGLLGEDGAVTLFASQESYRVKAQAAQALVHGRFATGFVKHQVTAGVSASEEKNYSSFAVADFLPGSLYAPNTSAQPDLVPLDVLPYLGKTTGRGLVLSDILELGERWSLLLGGRQARLDNFGADGTKDKGNSLSRFSPTAALMFKPTGASLLYANFAQGLETGGTAPTGTGNAGAVMPPLVTRQFEIGAKAEVRGTTLTAAVFDMRRPLQSRNGEGFWVQSGDQVHRGLELQASGAVTRDLRVVAGLMLLDAEQQTPNDTATDGKRVPGVARKTANLWADYRIAGLPGLFMNGGLYYTDRQHYDSANLQSIPAWTRVDLGARYETRAMGQPMALLLTVENATNRSYWQSALGNALTLGDPRTVKASARLRF